MLGIGVNAAFVNQVAEATLKTILITPKQIGSNRAETAIAPY